jgi:hypothetical protein
VAKPPDVPRRRVRPANLYHYIHKLESWNKLGELEDFPKLGMGFQAGTYIFIKIKFRSWEKFPLLEIFI